MEKEYEFDTEDGKKTLAELFDGRSQLLAYNIMFGPDYEVGACPGCSNLGDELDATRVHLNHRDVTLICFSRAPIDRLIAYKERMGWQFPYVSTYGTELPVRLRARAHARAGAGDPRGQGDDRRTRPSGSRTGARQVGAKLEDGLREGPSFIAFARENGSVYHTYTVMAPDPFVAPYHSFLLERTPKAGVRGAPRLAQGRVPGLIARGRRCISGRAANGLRGPRLPIRVAPWGAPCSAVAGLPRWRSASCRCWSRLSRLRR